MEFNFSLFAEQIKHSLFSSSQTPARLTPKRVGVLLLFFPIFFIIRSINFLGFKLDTIFYPNSERVKISEPVFILGNLRSGTTYLHRLMARDRQNFTYMRLWEIIFAQSIFVRTLVWKIKGLDDRSGRVFQKLLHYLEEKSWFSNPIHRIGLREAHEDEGVLISIWESIGTSTFFPFLHLVQNYAFFDKEISPEKQQKIMQFYKSCLKKHLFSRNASMKKFLSKNPSFSPKIQTILESFPDSKIIFLVRDPIRQVPSFISWMSFQWKKYIDWPDKYIHQHTLLELAREWYDYPLEILDQTADSRQIIVRYDDLVSNPQKIITKIYNKFGFEMSDEFDQILENESKKQRTYSSKHEYSLSEMELSEPMIKEKFQNVIERFDF